jgi:hypothetical protein
MHATLNGELMLYITIGDWSPVLAIVLSIVFSSAKFAVLAHLALERRVRRKKTSNKT